MVFKFPLELEFKEVVTDVIYEYFIHIYMQLSKSEKTQINSLLINLQNAETILSENFFSNLIKELHKSQMFWNYHQHFLNSKEVPIYSAKKKRWTNCSVLMLRYQTTIDYAFKHLKTEVVQLSYLLEDVIEECIKSVLKEIIEPLFTIDQIMASILDQIAGKHQLMI